jgi:serine/threonine protein kinase
VDDHKLTAYLQQRESTPLPPDPREAADEMVRDGLLTNFQAEQFLQGKWRGFTIGKYKLLERVGVGGMGQVFLAEHMFMKRRVAVKVLPPAKAEHPAALGRFYREARAAGSLEHPNVVRTHDIDQDGDLHFIVMEYVDGPNLLEVVKKFGPLDIGRAVHYIHQIALGLDYAFRTGIIHRDIKPGNILIDRHGTAKLLDMGLARFYRDQTDPLTAKYDDKIVLGTADYVAPEQVANSHAVDIRADVYSLGASLYFLLAGHPPFPSGAVSQKLLWHRTKEPTPIRQIRPEVPDELAAVVTRMMSKDPNQRYQTPADVAAELSHWVTADVARPSDAEMPRLSPAATETDDYCTPATPLPVSTFNASSSVVAVAQPRSVAAGPFAPAARPGPFAATEKPDNVLNTTLVHPVLSVDATPLCHTALPGPKPAGWLERIGEQSQTIIIVAVAVAVSFAAGILFWKHLGQ